MNYKIRLAVRKDAVGIAQVHVTSWRETYSGTVDKKYLDNLSVEKHKNKWNEILSDKKNQSWTLVAKSAEGEIVGFASAGKARETAEEPYEGELYCIYLLKKHQKNRLGFLLVKELCTTLKKNKIYNMYVGVLEDNESKTFYTKYGAEWFKSEEISIGNQTLTEEFYGWDSFDQFLQ
ncbi:MAG: L-amino acid N-acyltransferase YncA [Oceanicoccus sp.]|jgi:L-amino acid N-acyltransferase YncA